MSAVESQRVVREGFRAETRRATRGSGLLLGAIGIVAMLGWAGFDAALQPDNAALFLTLRLACCASMVAICLVLLTPAGERLSEPLVLLLASLPQVAIAVMVSRLDGDYAAYATGFSLAVYASAFLLVWPWRYTFAQVVLTWLALGIALLTAPAQPGGEQVATVAFYLGTACVLGLAGQWYRCRLAWDAYLARWELESEQAHNRELVTRLERLSALDELTGVANRRSWDDSLRQAVARARRSGAPLAVLLCDVNRFKQVNDVHGHLAGDHVLKQTAGLIAGRVRDGDLVARLGGDEFAVLCPDTGLDDALVLADALAERAGAAQLPDGTPVSFSIGVAALDADDRTIDDLVGRADACMYAAKRRGLAVSATPAI
jgi:diguanylate cyclase (GGDEF)-like protein